MLVPFLARAIEYVRVHIEYVRVHIEYVHVHSKHFKCDVIISLVQLNSNKKRVAMTQNKMRVIFFLLLVLFLYFVLGSDQWKKARKGKLEIIGIMRGGRFLGEKNYKNLLKREHKVAFPTPYEKYPKKIPSFVDDTYCEYVIL